MCNLLNRFVNASPWRSVTIEENPRTNSLIMEIAEQGEVLGVALALNNTANLRDFRKEALEWAREGTFPEALRIDTHA